MTGLTQRNPPLIGVNRQRAVIVIAGLGAAIAIGIAVLVWHGTSTSFDDWAFRRAYLDFPRPGTLGRRWWLWFSEPALSLAVPSAVALWAVVARQWNVLALAAAGPLIALGLAELVGKPLVARRIGPWVLQGSDFGALSGSYPSGHETALVSWLVLLVLLLMRTSVGQRTKMIGVGAAALWGLLGALGLTVNYYHYATDTIGAIGLATSCLLGVALGIDRWLPAGQLTWRS